MANMPMKTTLKVMVRMKSKKIPTRMCIGCGQMKEKPLMIRVIHTPEGSFELDATGRKNGRGAYICADKECLKKAIKSKGLERSFKMSIPKEVYDSLEEAFEADET